MGVAIGHVDDAALGLVTLVGLVTITASTYMILYSHKLYALFEPWLGVFERKVPFREQGAEEAPVDAEVIVIGMGRYGRRLAERLQEHGLKVLGIDFDPEVLAVSAHCTVPVVFGDADDEDFLAHLPLHSAKWIVSTLRDRDIDRDLAKLLRRQGFEGRLALTAHTGTEAGWLQEAGADDVFQPFQDAAEHAAAYVAEACRGGAAGKPA
jgi:hypothetical protein